MSRAFFRTSRSIFHAIAGRIDAKLGRCPFCMRASLNGAVAGWAALAAMYLVAPNTRLWWAVVPAAGAFTLLWMGHIAAFAARWLRRPTTAAGATDPARTVPSFSRRVTRRATLRLWARGAAVAVAFSLPPALLSPGYAQTAWQRDCLRRCDREGDSCVSACWRRHTWRLWRVRSCSNGCNNTAHDCARRCLR